MSLRKCKFKSILHIVVSFCALIFVGVIIATVSFYVEYRNASSHIINQIENVFIMFLTAIISLPKSFGNLVGITELGNREGFGLAFIIFWPILLSSIFFTFKYKMIYLYILSAVMFLMASVYWLVESHAMMGI
ncbi:hypothetical protein K8S19_05365 [bacterium]|nr:hypothetical protein [bacterium]